MQGINTKVEPVDNNIPNKFNLAQNYPNPFNPSTTIEYGVPNNGNVQIVIYNILGEKVSEVISEYHVAGNYSIKWKTDNLPSEINFYTLSTDYIKITKKMLLLK